MPWTLLHSSSPSLPTRSRRRAPAMEKERTVRPDCVNASNPFHVCADYCKSIPSESLGGGGSKSFRIEGLKLVLDRGRRKDESFKVVERQEVNPRCVNASNPFHKCADYCVLRTPDSAKFSPIIKSADRCVLKTPGSAKSSPNIESAKSPEAATVAEKRMVDPRCVNASNPYHKCAEYCSPNANGGVGNSAVMVNGSERNAKKMERKDVDRRCVNATNPYHKCADYCLERINEAA